MRYINLYFTYLLTYLHAILSASTKTECQYENCRKKALGGTVSLTNEAPRRQRWSRERKRWYLLACRLCQMPNV